MYFRKQSAVFFAAAFVLSAGLLVGCGGGDQSQDGSQGGSGGDQQEKKKDAPERKIALGTILKVNAETNRFAVKPSDPEQGKKPLKFRAGKGAKFTLEGKAAEFSDIKKGQQVQVEYVVKDDKNRAREVELFGNGGGTTPAGGETTG